MFWKKLRERVPERGNLRVKSGHASCSIRIQSQENGTINTLSECWNAYTKTATEMLGSASEALAMCPGAQELGVI